MVSQPTALSTGRHTGSETECRGVAALHAGAERPSRRDSAERAGGAHLRHPVEPRHLVFAPNRNQGTQQLIGSDREAVRLASLPAFPLYAGCCFPSTQPWKSGASFLPRACRTPTGRQTVVPQGP